jgi:hypothetical protein
VRATGSTPHPLPYGADYDDSSFDAELPGRAKTSGVARVNFDVKHVFVRPPPHQAADTMLEALSIPKLPVFVLDSAVKVSTPTRTVQTDTHGPWLGPPEACTPEAMALIRFFALSRETDSLPTQ